MAKKKLSESLREFYGAGDFAVAKEEVADFGVVVPSNSIVVSTVVEGDGDGGGAAEAAHGAPDGPDGGAGEVGAGVMVGDRLGNSLLVPLSEPMENTQGKKMIPVAIPGGMAAETFRRALSGAYQSYLETGTINRDAIYANSGVDKNRITFLLSSEEFAMALAVRGVEVGELSVLSPEQDATLMILTDLGSKKDWSGRLRAAGITQAKFNAWMKNPIFARRFTGIAEEITDNHGIALVELGRKVGQGDLGAIKLQLEVNNRHNPAQQSQLDMMVLLQQVTSILSKHLAGQPKLLQAVASDLRELAEAARMGGKGA